MIDEAPAGKRKVLALLEFAKGDAFAAHGKPDRAIEFYGLAWLVLKG